MTIAQAALAGTFTAQVILLVLRSQKTEVQTSASLAADVLPIVGTAGAAWLSYIDHQRSLRPSTLLTLYLSALVILDIPRVRTLWLMGGANGEAAAMAVTLILTAVALLLESTEKRSSVAEGEKRFRAPEEYSGFWTRTVFAWLVATFRAGYSKVLVQDDLPILDTRLQSSVLREKLVRTCAKCKHLCHSMQLVTTRLTNQPYVDDHRARYSLLKACFHANLFSFLSAIPPRLCRTVFYFTQPLLINTTVSYVGDASADIVFGRALIGAWALVFLGIAVTMT